MLSILHDHTRRRGFLIAGIGLLLLTIAVATIAIVNEERRNALEKVERDLRYRVDLHEAYIRVNVLSIDRAIQTLRAEIAESGIPADLRSWVNSRNMLREPVFQLAVTNKEGLLLASSEFGAVSRIDLSDRDHIKVHLEAKEDKIFFSVPLIGRASGRLSINVTRPFFNSKGEVDGVIVASVDPTFFSAYLQDFSFPGGYIAKVVGADGVIRARSDLEKMPAKILVVDGALLTAMKSSETTGITRSVFDDEAKHYLVAYQAIDGYDLYIAIGIDTLYVERAQMSGLWEEIAFASLIAILIIILAVGFDRIAFIQSEASAVRARAEERAVQLQRLGGLLASCDALMLRIDDDGRIIDANPAFKQMFRFSNNEKIPEQEAVTSPHTELVADIVAKAANANKYPTRFLSYTRDNDGRIREFLWSWTKLQGVATQKDEFIGVAVDHTDLRQNELMLIHASKLSSLGRQSAAICHELAQPLNVVSLGLDNLRREVLVATTSESLIKRFDRLSASIRRAGKILDRFRMLARPTSPSMTVLKIKSVVNSAIESVSDVYQLANIIIEVHAPRDANVRANSIELEQVFINILMNAKEAIVGRKDGRSEHSKVRITVDIVNDDQKVEVAVHDSGPGLPDELVKYGIRPFRSTKISQGGIGLGLAISDATIRSLGGELRFESRDGGASFIVTLPLELQNAVLDVIS
jgi:C4-dicarboxylate-specific signal transduction histidine kinase